MPENDDIKIKQEKLDVSQPKTDSDNVVSKTEKPSINKVKKPRVLKTWHYVFIAFTGVVLAFYAFDFYRHHQIKNTEISHIETIIEEHEVLDSIIANAENYAGQGEYEYAQELLSKPIDHYTRKGNKEMVGGLYLAKSNLAYNYQFFDDAVEFGLKSEEILPTAATASALGYAYEAKKDIEHAIKYFKLALERFEVVDELSELDANDLKEKIKELGGEI